MAKTYKCQYCEKRFIRKDLINHIENKHEEMIPEGFSASRLVYNQINKVSYGKCRVCGKETTWNEKAGRYNVLCSNPKCKEHMREEYKKNMLRVKGTYNILNDPEQQKKMLANRSISGKYKFTTDGGELTYTGSYEKKCLEFMDVVMQIPSTDILSPGPTLEYEYNGEKHFYITDFYYIPYNLIIEVKDGGDNPNNKKSVGMNSSREKTIEKERLITDKGEYNYIRLTNNNFAQLLEIFMIIKEKLLEGDISKTYKINESVILESSNNKRRILLTSTGFTNKNIEKVFKDNINKPMSKVKVIFVPTAANDAESRSIIPECYKDLTDAGVLDKNIITYNLDRKMFLNEIMNYDAIYFCGGSEQYLIDAINKINFSSTLTTAINNGLFFIGVSAGSMILTSSVFFSERRV